MSVIAFDIQEFHQLFTVLSRAQGVFHPIYQVPSAERFYEEKMNGDKYDAEECRQKHCAAFVARLMISNRMAHAFQYELDGGDAYFHIAKPPVDGWKIVPLPEIIRGTVGELKWLADKLSSIRYNLLTNAGRSFFSREDGDALDLIIADCYQQIATRTDWHPSLEK